MRILVIDDARIARAVLKKVLREIGHHDVAEAKDGYEGLEALEASDFDLVICDWLMPRLDGLAFLKAMKQTAAANVPVIMVTSESDVSRIVEVMRAGAYAYVRKPFAVEAIRQKIAEVQKRRELEQSARTNILSGSLIEIGFPELVQFLNIGRRSGQLQITSGRDEGRIEIREGEVRTASFCGLTSDEAFNALALCRGGHFRFERSSTRVENTMSRGTMALLMNGMRLRDEHLEQADGGR